MRLATATSADPTADTIVHWTTSFPRWQKFSRCAVAVSTKFRKKEPPPSLPFLAQMTR